jgi:hypothetical protein
MHKTRAHPKIKRKDCCPPAQVFSGQQRFGLKNQKQQAGHTSAGAEIICRLIVTVET